MEKLASNKISQEEAERLLKMLKRSIESQIDFPLKGNDTEFEVVGQKK